MPVTADMIALAAKIEALPPPERLRLAATFMEVERTDLAYSILERVTTELGAVIALRQIEARRPR